MSEHARLREVYGELLARAPEDAMEPRLEPVRRVCELLGDPQRAFPVVHLTGTNGKTSTARIVERLLREHNLRTGRFTSPHLTSVNERISVDGVPLTPDAFADVHEEVAPFVAIVDGELFRAGEPALTYFEVLAVMAFAAFADAPVDVAVVEVGLGGAWDATNVVEAAVAVVTTISLDHTGVLGDSLEAIAAEKAGILVDDGFLVMAEQPPGAGEVLMERARATNTKVAVEGRDFGVVRREVAMGGQQVTLRGLAAEYGDVFLPLHGEHQARNAAIAVAAVEAFLGDGEQAITGEVLAEALDDVTSPGRMEMLRPAPAVIVDAAHNAAGMAALVDTVEESFAFRHLVGVVGVLVDKDARTMLDLLEPVLDEVVVTRSTSRRAVAVDELAALATSIFGEDRVHAAERLDDALALSVNLAEAAAETGGGVLVTGSVTVVGEARVLLGARPVDVAVQLGRRQDEEPLPLPEDG
ncbi:MAG TPA: Mur ligase family protein [Actinomycetales bacterium]|nr:Mur ligase family protein [Actinomycetales bacterium]